MLRLAPYAVLTAAGILRPRPSYGTRRRATVFPLGTTAAAALSASTAIGAPCLESPGRVPMRVAVTAWLAVAAGAVTSARTAVTSEAVAPEIRSTARR